VQTSSGGKGRSRCQNQKVFALDLALCPIVHFINFFISQNTALNLSAMCGHIEVCKLLVSAKANVALKSRLKNLFHVHRYPELTSCITEAARLLFNSPSRTTCAKLPSICVESRRRSELLNDCCKFHNGRCCHSSPTQFDNNILCTHKEDFRNGRILSKSARPALEPENTL
jgi:hypothetical protein